MEWLALAILIIFCLVGFILNFFTGIGTLIILVGALLFSAITKFEVLTGSWLLVLGALYAFGEGFESISSVVGTKRMGGSSKAAFGGVIGGIIGTTSWSHGIWGRCTLWVGAWTVPRCSLGRAGD